MKYYKTPSKRIIPRASSGRFRKARPSDVGIGGVCECGHFLLRHINGDPRDRPVDPRKIRYRCFTCEPKTEVELMLDAEIKAARKPKRGFVEFLEGIE